jgi:hypothetical protein
MELCFKENIKLENRKLMLWQRVLGIREGKKIKFNKKQPDIYANEKVDVCKIKKSLDIKAEERRIGGKSKKIPDKMVGFIMARNKKPSDIKEKEILPKY